MQFTVEFGNFARLFATGWHLVDDRTADFGIRNLVDHSMNFALATDFELGKEFKKRTYSQSIHFSLIY